MKRFVLRVERLKTVLKTGFSDHVVGVFLMVAMGLMSGGCAETVTEKNILGYTMTIAMKFGAPIQRAGTQVLVVLQPETTPVAPGAQRYLPIPGQVVEQQTLSVQDRSLSSYYDLYYGSWVTMIVVDFASGFPNASLYRGPFILSGSDDLGEHLAFSNTVDLQAKPTAALTHGGATLELSLLVSDLVGFSDVAWATFLTVGDGFLPGGHGTQSMVFDRVYTPTAVSFPGQDARQVGTQVDGNLGRDIDSWSIRVF